MTLKKFILILSVIFPSILFAQREQVNIRVRNAAPFRKFEYHQPSNFDVVNGRLSAAVASANGYVFEINGIPAKQIKCDASFKQNQFKVVLIDNRMNRTYASNEQSKGSLFVNCLADGKIELLYTGDLWLGKQKVIINANLSGEINHSRNLKTN